MSTAPLPPVPRSRPGLGLPKEIPPELDRWNWGAFLLNWIWGLGNRTFLALLVFAPFVGFVMPFVLGAKGSAWAWKNGDWTSVEHFQRVQRRWAVWGVVAAVGSIVLFALLIGGTILGVGMILNDSPAYKLAVAKLRTSPQAIERLGSPIAAGNAGGSTKTADGVGEADLNFTATGPKGKGTVTLKAVGAGDAWRLTALRLKMDGQDGTVDIVRPEARLTGLRFKGSRDTEAGTTFKAGDKAVLLQFDQADVPVGTTLAAAWTKLKDTPDGEDETFYTSRTVIDDVEKNLITFTVTFKDGWQAGRYRVDIAGDGIPAKSATFTVTE